MMLSQEAVFFLGAGVLIMCLILYLRRGAPSALFHHKNHSSVQVSFSKAVNYMESALEHEKAYNAQLERALNTVLDGVAILDQKQQITFANAALWKHYGVASGNINLFMGKSWLSLYNEEGRAHI